MKITDYSRFTTNALDHAIKERREQFEKHNYSIDNDAGYKSNELELASIAYATPEHLRVYRLEVSEQSGVVEPVKPNCFPFDAQYWKPSPDRVKELSKAVGLLLASIDAELYKEQMNVIWDIVNFEQLEKLEDVDVDFHVDYIAYWDNTIENAKEQPVKYWNLETKTGSYERP